MARLSGGYNPADVEAGMDFDPLPPGVYPAEIIESAVEPTKTGSGEKLELTWRIVDDAEKYAGRQFWQTVNYINNSAQAQLIGQQQLKQICEAVGYEGHLDDSEVLHHVACNVRVKIERQEGYADKNVVVSVKPLGAAPPAGKPAARPSTARAAAPAGQQRPAARSAAPGRGGKAPAKPAGNRPWQQSRQPVEQEAEADEPAPF